MKKKFLLILSILIFISLACSVSGNNASSDPDPSEIATSVAATLESQTIESTELPGDELTPTDEPSIPTEVPLTPTEEPDYLLPRSLYYLSETTPENYQVWRLERDGLTSTQITNELESINNYTVNPVDGRVVFVVNNQIFQINSDSSGRVMLVDGGPIDELSDVYHYHTKISGLAWSPDGNILAYGRGGLNFYNFSTGLSSLLIPNVTTDYGGFLGPETLYFPSSWSPNGSHLMLSIGWLEGGTYSIYNPASGINTVLGYGITCCDYEWSRDGTNILVGSPVLGLIESGLWRYARSTGAETVLLPSEAADGTFNFAGWPKELPNGDLLFFYNNLAIVPENTTPLTLVHTAADGITGLFQVRPESWVIYEALWDRAGSQVVVVEPSLGPYSYPRRGPIILIDTAGGPLTPLALTGFNLQWGP